VPRFEAVQTQSVQEAIEALFERAVPVLPVCEETFILEEYQIVASSWKSQRIFRGSKEQLIEVVSRNLERITQEDGFQQINVGVIKKDKCAQVSVSFGGSFVPVRVWRGEIHLYACGNTHHSIIPLVRHPECEQDQRWCRSSVPN
jgi:hypothetical protein